MTDDWPTVPIKIRIANGGKSWLILGFHPDSQTEVSDRVEIGVDDLLAPYDPVHELFWHAAMISNQWLDDLRALGS